MVDERKDDVTIDENDELITMTFDDGTSENFYNLAELDYEGKWYMYLEPVDPPEDYEEGDVYIYEEAEDDNGEEILLPVEDEDLLETLIKLLNDELDAK